MKDTIMTTIAILGAGRVGSALAAGFAGAGHDVLVGVRSTEQDRANMVSPALSIVTMAEAVARAEIVVNAMPGDVSLEALIPHRGALAGKILIDVANATARRADGMPAGLLYPQSSLGEQLQLALPNTRVVKTLNTMLFSVMTKPASMSTAPTAFLSGDDEGAKARVGSLLQDLGWNPSWLEDLGGIASAQGTEAFILLVPHVLKARGFVPFSIALARRTGNRHS